MTERPDAAAAIPDIEALAAPTHDEYARQRFCSMLRRHAIQDLPPMLEEDFLGRVGPGAAAKGARLESWRDIENVMKDEDLYQFYSSVRYNVQEMCFQSVQPQVERALPQMIEVARTAARRNPAGGSLRLNANLAIPSYISALDVHLTPGCFHSEYTADDVAQGAVFSLGARVFGAQQSHRTWGGVAKAIGRWVRASHPDMKPGRILDVGTTCGNNLFPYLDFLTGAEAYGIDLCAPGLRYGHALAGHAGLPVHFSQQNAERTDFPDAHFDLIVSSFLFHEVPLKTTAAIMRECYRLLKPGGLMVHQELPAENLVDSWENYFWNWDTRNNNEPYYTAFRAQDPIRLCVEAGFDAARSFAHIIPDAKTYPDRLSEFAWDEPGRPKHGNGGWYVFGSSKPRVN